MITTITTRRDQRDTAAAARRVDGYDELVRLTRERQRINGTVTRDVHTGEWRERDRDPA